jgi:hypothetical protein
MNRSCFLGDAQAAASSLVRRRRPERSPERYFRFHTSSVASYRCGQSSAWVPVSIGGRPYVGWFDREELVLARFKESPTTGDRPA